MFFSYLFQSGVIPSSVSQVAALQFGEFYDMQYVKMYTIFMMQLQVVFYYPCLKFEVFCRIFFSPFRDNITLDSILWNSS